VRSCLLSKLCNGNQWRLQPAMAEGWIPAGNRRAPALQRLLEEAAFKLKSEISTCSPDTLRFCQVAGLEITSAQNCEGMAASHQRRSGKSGADHQELLGASKPTGEAVSTPKTLLGWSPVVSQEVAGFVYLTYLLLNTLLILPPCLVRLRKSCCDGVCIPALSKACHDVVSSVGVQHHSDFLCQQRQTIIKKIPDVFSACSKTSEVHGLLSDWHLLPSRRVTTTSLLFFFNFSEYLLVSRSGFGDEVPAESTVSRSDCTRDHTGKAVQQCCTR